MNESSSDRTSREVLSSGTGIATVAAIALPAITTKLQRRAGI